MPQDDIAQLMQLGLQSHQAGQLQQAEHLYRQVLAQQPNEFDALHMLGVLLSQRREFDVAVHLLERAITLNPNYAQIHFNLGLAPRLPRSPEQSRHHVEGKWSVA
jgi:Flp pilus assembly protein TadD